MNLKLKVAYNFNFRIENEGLLKVTDSHVKCKSANLYIIIHR